MGQGFKEYGVYHAWYNVAWWKSSYRVCKGGVIKAYKEDSKCSSILVVCYVRVDAKMQNVGDGELKFPIW